MTSANIYISYFQNGSPVNPYDLLSVNYPLNYTGFVYINDDINQRVINGTIFVNGNEIPFIGTTFSGSINITKVENILNVSFISGIYNAPDINDLFYGDVITYNANITTAKSSYVYNENFIVNVNLNLNLFSPGTIELLLIDESSTQQTIKVLPLNGDDYMFNINSGDINIGNYIFSIRVLKDGYSEMPVGLCDIAITKYSNLDFTISTDIKYPKYKESFNLNISSLLFNSGNISITNNDTLQNKIFTSIISPYSINSDIFYDELGLVKGINNFNITYDDLNQTGTKLFTIFINKNKPTINIINNSPEYLFGDLFDLTSTATFNGNPITGTFEYFYINDNGQHILLNLSQIYNSNIYKIYSKFTSLDSFFSNNVSDVIEIQIKKLNITPNIAIEDDIINITFPEIITGTILLHFTTSNPISKYNYTHQIDIDNDFEYSLDINNIITNIYKFNYSIKAQFFGNNYNNTFSNLITYTKNNKNNISITNINVSSNNDFSKPVIFSLTLPDQNIFYGDALFTIKDTDNETIVDLYADINGGIASISYYTLKVGNYIIQAKTLENQLYFESSPISTEFSIEPIKLNILPLTKITQPQYIELLCGVDKSNINVGSLIFYNHSQKIGLGSFNVKGGLQRTYIPNFQYSEGYIRCYYYGLPNFFNSDQSNFI